MTNNQNSIIIPEVLYYGTSSNKVADILSQGIQPDTSCKLVTLYPDTASAYLAEKKKGKSVALFKVDVKAMLQSNIKVATSDNMLSWQTEHVPNNCIEHLPLDKEHTW